MSEWIWIWKTTAIRRFGVNAVQFGTATWIYFTTEQDSDGDIEFLGAFLGWRRSWIFKWSSTANKTDSAHIVFSGIGNHTSVTWLRLRLSVEFLVVWRSLLVARTNMWRAYSSGLLHKLLLMLEGDLHLNILLSGLVLASFLECVRLLPVLRDHLYSSWRFRYPRDLVVERWISPKTPLVLFFSLRSCTMLLQIYVLSPFDFQVARCIPAEDFCVKALVDNIATSSPYSRRHFYG